MRSIILKQILDELCEIEDALIHVRDAELEQYENIPDDMKDGDLACRLLDNYDNLDLIKGNLEFIISVIDIM